nr:MAG TPA: zinc finger domain protein [Caudoviricetes sp.]
MAERKNDVYMICKSLHMSKSKTNRGDTVGHEFILVCKKCGKVIVNILFVLI